MGGFSTGAGAESWKWKNLHPEKFLKSTTLSKLKKIVSTVTVFRTFGNKISNSKSTKI